MEADDSLSLYPQAMLSRYNCTYFDQENYPNKKVIHEILERSLEKTPVFANIWHHKVDLYGPEYKDEKRKLCLSTVEDMNYRKKFDLRNNGESGMVETLTPHLDNFENKIKNNQMTKLGKEVSFNTQVLAPYLLKFSFSHYHYGNKIIDDNNEQVRWTKIKGYQSSMAHAFAVALVANYYKLEASFCGCVIQNNENKNKIWYNDTNMIFFMGLGYKSEHCYRDLKEINQPLFDNICEWQNDIQN